MNRELNLMISGLSGQGIVMMGRILSTALLADGNRVCIVDSPALTHRNATTYTQIRIGEEVQALRIAEGEADLLLALEPNEGFKVGVVYAREDGLVILNDRVVKRSGTGDPAGSLRDAGIKNVKVIAASDVAANELGRLVTLNMVMLGAGVATEMIPVQMETVERTIRKFSPPSAVDLNVEAFRLGIKRFQEQA